MAVLLLTFLIAFFHPGIEYRTKGAPSGPIDTPQFARLVELIADTESHSDTRVDVLTNGDVFYEAELEAIRHAKDHICLEAYIFQRGEIATRFVQALTERARAG